MCANKAADRFPLIQLPRKSEVGGIKGCEMLDRFPLIQLPRKSEETIYGQAYSCPPKGRFPLIQLPRKSEEQDEDGYTVVSPSFH